ncbi:MAG TPA: DUF1398 family protein [Dehalococcoidia bacterium]|nr:DUF1398 family protein [Dehalococcoidia bacterium]
MTVLESQINTALSYAAGMRPKVGGFPYLAEVLRQTGVTRILVNVPGMTTTFVTPEGSVVQQGEPQVTGAIEMAPFDAAALIAALRADQAGLSSYPEFMAATWAAGVLTYDVDLNERTCTYRSPASEAYTEAYAVVEVPAIA